MTLNAIINWVTLPCSALGVLKRFAVYMPPCTDRWPSDSGLPVLYLFRGHETEWLGNQDGREGLVNILQSMIILGEIRPMVVVMPGFMPVDRSVQGVPVDWSADTKGRGVGTGRFKEYFFEVKEWVESHLPVGVGRRFSAVDGFSMGGYASLLLGTEFPDLFCSVGAYDGSFMWGSPVDPRRKGKGSRLDRLWTSESCAPFFEADDERDEAKFDSHNPVLLIKGARGRTLTSLKAVGFHIETVSGEKYGNHDRCIFVLDALKERGIGSSFSGGDVVLSPRARHDWAWADRHLRRTLPLHNRLFA